MCGIGPVAERLERTYQAEIFRVVSLGRELVGVYFWGKRYYPVIRGCTSWHLLISLLCYHMGVVRNLVMFHIHKDHVCRTASIVNNSTILLDLSDPTFSDPVIYILLACTEGERKPVEQHPLSADYMVNRLSTRIHGSLTVCCE